MSDSNSADAIEDANYPGAQLYGEEEIAALREVIERKTTYRFYGIEVPDRVDQLEEVMRGWLGREHALAVSSGTAALHTALAALEVGPGDEVILPAFGWVADVMAILAVGAVPVIAPVDASLGLDPDALGEALSEKTKAIIAIHMRGYPCRIEALSEVAKERGIALIEDAAQAFGARIGGGLAGSFGDASVFSFQYHKLLTAGEGGMVLTGEEATYTRARRFADNGLLRGAGIPDPVGLDCIGGFGLNYRMTELQAAILLAQHKKLGGLLESLRAHKEAMLDRLAPIAKEHGLRPRALAEGHAPNHAFICYQAPSKEAAEAARQAIAPRSAHVEIGSDLNGHHYRTWARFLDKEGRPYRLVGAEESERHLERVLMLT